MVDRFVPGERACTAAASSSALRCARFSDSTLTRTRRAVVMRCPGRAEPGQGHLGRVAAGGGSVGAHAVTLDASYMLLRVFCKYF